jgi:hypothetical protein
MMDNMQHFKTNDNITLKYFDTGAAVDGEDEKPWLILVRCFSFGPLQRHYIISTFK